MPAVFPPDGYMGAQRSALLANDADFPLAGLGGRVQMAPSLPSAA